jgi:hypothetical protein
VRLGFAISTSARPQTLGGAARRRDMMVVDWLLDSDPAIRWQVMRDLRHEPTGVVAAERSRIATKGWGARVLALQAPDGGGVVMLGGWPPARADRQGLLKPSIHE